MSREDDGKLWTRLSEAGLVQGPLPLPSKTDSPWYVRAMMGVAGWIGAIFLLLFLAVGFKFIMDSEMARMVVGILLCGAAAWLFKIGEENDFLSQFAFAISLTGQVLIVSSFAEIFDWRGGQVSWPTAALEIALFFLISNFLHRVWCAFAAGMAIGGAFNSLGTFPLFPALAAAGFSWAFLQEFEKAAKGIDKKALGYGLTIALLFSMFTKRGRSILDIFEGRHSGDLFIVPWIGGVLAAIVLVATVYVLLKRRNAPMEGRTGLRALACAILLALMSLKAPGIGIATLILVVGFAHGNRLLTGMGIAAQIGYLSYFYYNLENTLLEKSILMAVSGIVLLAVRFIFLRRKTTPEKGGGLHA